MAPIASAVAQLGRRDEWEDESDGQGPIVRGSVDDLYRRLGERFLAGDTATAVAGYRRLLDAAAAAVDEPSGVYVSGSDDVAREALARLVRALLEDRSQPVESRATAAVDALDTYRYAAITPTVDEVVDARSGGFGDDPSPLRAWLDACEREARARLSWDGRPFHDWLVELVARLDGADGLSRLATDATYPHRVQACEAWLDRLEDAGRVDDAVAAATGVVDTLDRSLDRAGLADRLARLHRNSGDRAAACAAGLRALRDDPSLYRLRHVRDDAESSDQLEEVTAELVDATDRDGFAAPMVRIAVLALAGGLGDVAADHTGDGPFGGGPVERRDATSVGVGLLLLGSRTAHDDLAARLCEQLVATIDQPRHDDHRLAPWQEVRGRQSEPEPDPAELGPRLCAAVTATPPTTAHLGPARDLVAAFADRVLGAKLRARYATVARLVVALAHTTAEVDGTPAAEVIAEYDARFRRFSAFRAELRTATEAATAGAPPGRQLRLPKPG